MTEKRCTQCGTLAPLTAFYVKRANRDGFETRCKPCLAEARRIYRENNREKERERGRRYRERYPDHWKRRDPAKRLAADKKRRERLKSNAAEMERRRAWWRAYYARNREKELARAVANYAKRKAETGKARPDFSVARFPARFGGAPMVVPAEVICAVRRVRVE